MRLSSLLAQQQQGGGIGGPEGYPSQSVPKGGKQYVAGRYWPIIGITALTVGSMWVWWRRKAATDVELRSLDTRGTLPNVSSPPSPDVPGFGRKSAEATGLMEGDRAFQGIFPTKKITAALEPVLPTAGGKGGIAKEQEERK